MDDFDLLQQYARDGTQSAMAELVRRHIDLVYASAVRRLRGDRATAEDVTQGVFIILARKANSIAPGAHLTAWLLKTTRYVAANAMRLAAIRRRHEQIAAEQVSEAWDEDDSAEEHWRAIAPLLDDAVAQLAASDRRIILLRFFEGRSLAEVGETVGISADAARKRIERAIGKLRRYFARRGIETTSAGLLGAIETRTVEAAPARLAPSVTNTACGAQALTTHLSTLVEGAMRMMFLKKAAATAGVLVLLAMVCFIGFVVAHLATSPRPVAAAASAAQQSVDQILERHLDARGGREKLAAVKSVRMTGPLDLGGGATAQLTTEQRRPDRFRQDFVMNGQTNVRAYDGKTAWYHIPFMGIREPTVMPPDELANILEEADIDGPLVDHKNKGHTIELVGREAPDGHECYKLKVALKNGKVRYHFLDAQTMQLVRVEGQQTEQGQEVSYVQKLSDFRDVNGVMFPFVSEVEQTSPGGAQKFVYRIEKIETNVPMDDAHFQMPATQPATKP
jgi:RNA polymerase sigma factor (sigma-70 family)